MRHHAKCADRSNRYRDFWIFRNGGRRHLGILNVKFVRVQTVKRVKLRHRAKFRRNRYNRGRDMAIFRIFKMAAVAILDF